VGTPKKKTVSRPVADALAPGLDWRGVEEESTGKSNLLTSYCGSDGGEADILEAISSSAF